MTAVDQVAAGRSEATAIEQARAVAEVAAAVRVARDFPRDEGTARRRMQAACSTQAMADRAFYSLPRAGGRVEGSTVHLARELAGCWGNLDYGIRELRRDDRAGESEMQAWAWDQETNVRSSRSFVVPHARMKGSGPAKRREALTDLGEIANNNNSVAARAVRETIFTVLPVWFVTEAEGIAAGVLQGDQTEGDWREQIPHVVAGFNSLGVHTAQVEAYVGAPVADWTPQILGGLRVLGGEIQRGEKRVADEFATDERTATTVAELADQNGGQS